MENPQRSWFLPVFIHKNPPAALHTDERYIYYPWFEDRSGQHWAIVRAESVIEGRECLPRGDGLNPLVPALVMTRIQGLGSSFFAGWLEDIDNKWIRRPLRDFVLLTVNEATEKLRNAEWVKTFYGEPGKNLENKNAAEPSIVSLESGLFETKEQGGRCWREGVDDDGDIETGFEDKIY